MSDTHSSANMQVWLHYYVLNKRVRANMHDVGSVQQGALIKVQDKHGHDGYADLCPWPSLGDKTLEEEISSRGHLYQRAFNLALKDLEARKNKIKLITDEPIKNNILIAEYKNWNPSEHFDYSKTIAKIKGDQDLDSLYLFLNKHSKTFKKIRIDFNFCLTEDLFANFIEKLTTNILQKIDYVEDPFEFNASAWAKFHKKVKLALDWRKSSEQTWHYIIQKPSREEVDEFASSTLTSAMDHPVGIAHGLIYAQMYPCNFHGFSTLDQYEPNEFYASFVQSGVELVYNSDGYGIGFTTLLNKINWVPLIDWQSEAEHNFLFSNPRGTKEENNQLWQIKNKFSTQINDKGYVLIPSSGSTQSLNASVKVVALKKSALINSAKRVNHIFNIDSKAVWGCVLPLYHVGGLSQIVRAELAQAKIFYGSWNENTIDWIERNKITHISLVPTQIYDIVKNNWRSPAHLQKVFVGGASLSSPLAKTAQDLGWPLTITYGMTETSSMIAAKNNYDDVFYHAFPDILLKQNEIGLQIKCDSTASYVLRLNLNNDDLDRELIVESIADWLQTEDQVEFNSESFTQFKFISRQSDFVKIKGEGVSLSELRLRLKFFCAVEQLDDDALDIIAVESERDGHALVMVVNSHLSHSIVEKIANNLNAVVRPYEKIQLWCVVDKIPISDLGKVKYSLLKEMVRVNNVKKI